MDFLRSLALGFLIFVIVFGYTRIIADAHLAEAVHFNGKDANRSFVAASKAYIGNPHDKAPMAIIGRSLLVAGKYRIGVEALERYTKVYPYDLNALINLGVGYLLIGKDASSIKDRVRKISPKYVEQIKLR